MSALSKVVAEEFCKLCDWSYQVWLNHRALFDNNPRAAELKSSSGADALKNGVSPIIYNSRITPCETALAFDDSLF